MVALQHGLATLTTLGPLTDDILQQANGTAFLASPFRDQENFIRAAERLAGDAALRRSLGEAAERFYAVHFGWNRVAETVLRVLTDQRRRVSGGSQT